MRAHYQYETLFDTGGYETRMPDGGRWLYRCLTPVPGERRVCAAVHAVEGARVVPAACRECGGRVFSHPNRVEGVYSDRHNCNAACMFARGPSCECSCGGANHAGGWVQ